MEDTPQPSSAGPADASTPAAGADMDPRTADPRELMRMLLPAARSEYIRAWEFLADAATTLERRRLARERARRIAEDHAILASALRTREQALRGEDLLNARHLASELERHAEALTRLVTLSPIGLQGSADLRPEALGCGRRYRDPARAEEAAAATRGMAHHAKSGVRDKGSARGPRQGSRGDARPREPKPPRDALGTSKHDSQVADDLDEATRAKLEELRRALEG